MAGKKFALSVVIQGVDRITAPLQRAQRRINQVFSPLRRLRQSVTQLGRASGITKLSKAFVGVGGAVRRVLGEVVALGGKLAGLAGTAAGAGFAMLYSFARSGDEVANWARRLGVGVQWLQEMRFAAERSGVTWETLSLALQRAGRRIGEFAATGKGEAAPVLQAMGIQIRNVDGSLRSLDTLMPEILDKLAGVRDEGIRNAAAMKLFDSEGVALVQMLADGVEGVDALRAEFRRLGGAISDEGVASSGQFINALTNLKTAAMGLRNIFGEALLPVVTDLIGKLTELVVANRERVRAWAQEFARELPGRLRQLRDWIVKVIDKMRPLASWIMGITANVGAMKTVLIAIIALMSGQLLVSLVAAAGAFKALGVAMLTTPVGWVMAAIAAIAGAAYLIYRNWDGISEWFGNLWGGVKDTFSEFWDWLGGWADRLSGMIDNILDTVLEPMRSLRSLWDKIPASIRAKLGFGDETGSAAVGAAAATRAVVQQRTERRESTVRVQFDNVPRGTRIEQRADPGAEIDMNLGYAMMVP